MKNSEFQGNSKFPKNCDYASKYLSELAEKWMVKWVKLCGSGPVSGKVVLFQLTLTTLTFFNHFHFLKEIFCRSICKRNQLST